MGIADDDQILQNLRTEDAFFTSLINTIPPSFYFDEESRNKIKAKKQDAFAKKADAMGLPKHGKGRSIGTKHIRLKLDPNEQKTVTQLQKELAEDERKEKLQASKKVTYGIASEFVRENMQNKIQQLKGKRKDSTDADREKKKAQRLLEKTKKKRRKTKEPKAEAKPELKEKKQTLPKKGKFNKDGSVLFSKFEFADESKRKKSDGKDYEALLNKVKKEKEQLADLKLKDPDKAQSLKEKSAWMKAIKMAEGSKIKDDPELLKKAMRKKMERKVQSEKKWTQRKEGVEEKMKKRQERRKANISKKKQDKVKKKVKRAIKKGRFIPA